MAAAAAAAAASITAVIDSHTTSSPRLPPEDSSGPSPADRLNHQQQHHLQQLQHHHLQQLQHHHLQQLQHHQFLSVIAKVANWIATSDRQVCLFADDKSLSTLSPSDLSETGELERTALTERLQRVAIGRMLQQHGCCESQANNHNEQRRATRQRRGLAGRRDTEDPHLERVIARASSEIRSAMFRLRDESRLPSAGLRLRVRLSIEPGRGSQIKKNHRDH